MVGPKKDLEFSPGQRRVRLTRQSVDALQARHDAPSALHTIVASLFDPKLDLAGALDALASRGAGASPILVPPGELIWTDEA